jgi:anti-anti-sigma factor
MLRISIQAAHPNVTLHCSGRIVLGLETETLRCMATSRAEHCLTLDLSGVRALDAAGIGLLVELQCWAQQAKKALRIAKPSACVRRLMDLTNLQSLLQVGDCGKFGSNEEWDRAALPSGVERAMSA